MTPKQRLSLILILSVLLRVALALYLGNDLSDWRGGTADQISYDALAQRVVGGHGFSFAVDSWPYAHANQPTAFWSYLYTLYLAAVYAVSGHYPLLARLIQAIAVGLLMPWLTYRIGHQAFGNRVALIAAALVAVYAYFIHYAASLMSEAFYIVGILWTVDVSLRLVQAFLAQPAPALKTIVRLGIELGIAMAITLLLRQVVIVFFGVLAVWFLWQAVKYKAVGRAILPLLLAVIAFLLLISPFVVRNYWVFGQLALPNTNAGFTFFWSNHPIYGTQFEAVLSPEQGVSYQELIPSELRHLNEAQLDRALLARGLQFVRDDPGRYLLLSLSRIPIFFQFWPTPHSTFLSNLSRVLSFGLFLPLMVYGLTLAIWDLRPRGRLHLLDGDSMNVPDLRSAYVYLFLLFMAVYTGVHLASWANVRYRLPVDAFLILFAAYGLVGLFGLFIRLIRWSPFSVES